MTESMAEIAMHKTRRSFVQERLMDIWIWWQAECDNRNLTAKSARASYTNNAPINYLAWRARPLLTSASGASIARQPCIDFRVSVCY